jgi:DMSO/TMAO reductase YedYZ heme-binding membrane subunit
MKSVRTAALIFALTLSYATFRYHVFGSSDWTWFAFWTTNKALSWTATALIALAYLVQNKDEARRLGSFGFFLAAWHCLVSLVLLGPGYYAKLYSGSSITGPALASMLLGGVGFVAFCFPAWTSRPGLKEKLGIGRWLTWQRMGYAGLGLTAAHCLAIGLPGWLTPSKWPGMLPPITLMGFLTALLPAIRLVRRRI